MKKHLLILITTLAALTGTTKAQTNLSLDIGYSNTGYSHTFRNEAAFDATLPRGQEARIAPRIGFRFGENLAAGLQIEVAYSSYTFTDGFYNPVNTTWEESATTDETLLSASAGAYLRLRLAQAGRLSLHLELSGSYAIGFGSEIRTETRVGDGNMVRTMRRRQQNTITARLVPVAEYAFNSHISAEARFNLTALAFTATRTLRWPYGTVSHVRGADPESQTDTRQFGIGLNTLHASPVTLGLSYTF